MKVILQYLVCEMQVTDEKRAERIMICIETILSLGKSSSQSTFIIEQI